MAGIRGGLACMVALLLIRGGPIAAKSEARSSSGVVADGAVKESQDLIGGSNQGKARLPVGGDFQSAPKLFRLGRFAEAERQFAWIAEVRRGTTWGERGQYYLAECQFQQKKYVQAHDSYEKLYVDYPATAYKAQLTRREYEIAQIWLAQADPKATPDKKLPWTARFDGRLPLIDTSGWGLKALEHVQHNDPDGPIADKAAIRIADYYMNQADYASAVLYYDQFITEYCKSRFRSHARFAAIECAIRRDLEPRWRAAGLR